jgi:hypothetical protein
LDGCASNRLLLRYKACPYRHMGCALRLASGDWRRTQHMKTSVNRPCASGPREERFESGGDDGPRHSRCYGWVRGGCGRLWLTAAVDRKTGSGLAACKRDCRGLLAQELFGFALNARARFLVRTPDAFTDRSRPRSLPADVPVRIHPPSAAMAASRPRSSVARLCAQFDRACRASARCERDFGRRQPRLRLLRLFRRPHRCAATYLRPAGAERERQPCRAARAYRSPCRAVHFRASARAAPRLKLSRTVSFIVR